MTPEGRYQQDTQFRTLVDLMESYIARADFTPSEIRLAAMMASIHYEMYRLPRAIHLDKETEEALNVLHRTLTEEKGEKQESREMHT